MSAQSQETVLQDRTVGEIAATLPGATAVFRKHKLDFCCGGDVALDEAARRHGIDPAAVERELRALGRSDAAPASEATPALIRHIVDRYHETHRRELPELIKLARKVEAVHAEHPQVPSGLADTLRATDRRARGAHEEGGADPLSGDGARCRGRARASPVAEMRHDHDDHGAQLRRLAALTNGYALPEGACRSWQALYAGTAKLADDLMEHIHLENNVLFPRFEEPRAS